MTIKTYSRARVAVANARAFCEKNSILAAGFEARDGLGLLGFTCVIHAAPEHAATITAGGWMFRQAETPELPQGLVDPLTFEEAPGGVDYPAPEPTTGEEAAPVVGKAKAPGYIAEVSSAIGPTKMVWHVADAMKGQPRKAVIEECRKRGIAYGTARTQYQAWKSANGL